MKKEIAIILFLFAFCSLNLWLNLRPDEKQTNDPNYELFEYRFKEMQGRIDTLSTQINSKDEKIDSNIVFVESASRNTRDSLRAIYNPR